MIFKNPFSTLWFDGLKVTNSKSWKIFQSFYISYPCVRAWGEASTIDEKLLVLTGSLQILFDTVHFVLSTVDALKSSKNITSPRHLVLPLTVVEVASHFWLVELPPCKIILPSGVKAKIKYLNRL